MKAAPCPGCEGERRQTFVVEGLDCAAEVALIEERLGRLEGVCSVQASAVTGETTVVHTLAPGLVERAFADAGLPARETTAVPPAPSSSRATVAAALLAAAGFVVGFVSPRRGDRAVPAGHPGRRRRRGPPGVAARAPGLARHERADDDRGGGRDGGRRVGRGRRDGRALLARAAAGVAQPRARAARAGGADGPGAGHGARARAAGEARRAAARIACGATTRRGPARRAAPARRHRRGRHQRRGPVADDGRERGASPASRATTSWRGRSTERARSTCASPAWRRRRRWPACCAARWRRRPRARPARASWTGSRASTRRWCWCWRCGGRAWCRRCSARARSPTGPIADWCCSSSRVRAPWSSRRRWPWCRDSPPRRGAACWSRAACTWRTSAACARVVFDKTGTLSTGRPEVTDVLPVRGLGGRGACAGGGGRRRAARTRSREAVLARARAGGDRGRARRPTSARSPAAVSQGRVDGRLVLVGSHRLFDERGLCDHRLDAELRRLESEGKSALLVGDEEGVVGALAVADGLRPEAEAAVRALRAAGSPWPCSPATTSGPCDAVAAATRHRRGARGAAARGQGRRGWPRCSGLGPDRDGRRRHQRRAGAGDRDGRHRDGPARHGRGAGDGRRRAHVRGPAARPVRAAAGRGRAAHDPREHRAVAGGEGARAGGVGSSATGACGRRWAPTWARRCW